MHKTYLSKTSHKAAQTYRFEFGSDEKLYSVSFSGTIPKPEIRRILECTGSALYEKCSECIRCYLDSHHLHYSDFFFCEKIMAHKTVMDFADRLLHDSSCSGIDEWIGDTDFYYGMMDYQHWTDESCCEGCYYAVTRTLSAQDVPYEYHMISQTFQYDESSSREQSHFAIRKAESGNHLRTLDEENGWPVLAAFGCINITKLLMDIGLVTTKEQAADLAN